MHTNPDLLVGTPHNPPGYEMIRNISRAARAYHDLFPYPQYSQMTRDWKIEDRGPFPRCLPFVNHIVEKGVQFLFARPLTFRCETDSGTETVTNTWTANDMTRRSLVVGRIGALSGGVALKWWYDKEEGGVKIDVLDPAEQTRFYWDSLYTDKLLMVRTQVPVWNHVKGYYEWCREDWTDKTHVVYKPVPVASISQNQISDPYTTARKADGFEHWEIDYTEKNPFKVIPFWYIKNREDGTQYGLGDLWRFYNIVDLVNFTRDLEHKSNQKIVNPDKAFIDLAAPENEANTSANPVEVDVLETKDGAGQQGKIWQFEQDPDFRIYLNRYAEELMKQLYDATGCVDIDYADVTNKGYMTAAVMHQLYAPLIDRTEEKRQCYGEDGLCVFFERMGIGMRNAGVEGWDEVEDVQAVWPSYFSLAEAELMEAAERQVYLVQNNLTTMERAIRYVAAKDSVIDVDNLIEEIQQQFALKAIGANVAQVIEVQEKEDEEQKEEEGYEGFKELTVLPEDE